MQLSKAQSPKDPTPGERGSKCSGIDEPWKSAFSRLRFAVSLVLNRVANLAHREDSLLP